MLTRSLIAIVLVILLGYGAVEAAPLVAGPDLVITTPLDGATALDGMVEVTGVATRVNSLSLNGGPLLIDESGNFSRLIVLPRGSAILTLTASDRFGRSITKEISVYVP